MCLILFAWKVHPHYQLVLAANRDEFYERSTRQALWWPEDTRLLAGKDLVGGGSWMGINRKGEWAALTNYREVNNIRNDAPTRGFLVTDFLSTEVGPKSYVNLVDHKANLYNGFNLLIGDQNEIWHYSNRGDRPTKIAKGVYGLSNHLLNTPWPKVKKGMAGLSRWLETKQHSVDSLFEMLQDKEMALDKELPNTGVSMEWERKLSAMFIKSKEYGTRVSTILTISYDQIVHFEERPYVPEGQISVFDFNAQKDIYQ